MCKMQIDWMQWIIRKGIYMIREILKDDLDGLLRLYMQLHNMIIMTSGGEVC